MTLRASSGASESLNGPQVIDCRAALDRIGGDRELLRELAEIFVEDSPQLLAALTTSLADRNCGQAEHFAHGLKGIAANVGGVRVEELAYLVEEAARSGQLEIATAGLQRLPIELDRLIIGLREAVLNDGSDE